MRHARMMEGDDNYTRKTAAEIDEIQSDQAKKSYSPGGKRADKVTTSAWFPLELFAGKFGQGMEILDELEECTKQTFIETAKACGKGCGRLIQLGV